MGARSPRVDELREERALRAMEGFSALGQVLSSVQRLVSTEDRRPGGPHHWPVVRRRLGAVPRPLLRVLDAASDERAVRVLQAARIVAGAALLLPVSSSRARVCCDVFLVATSALAVPQQHYGSDGSDQVAMMTHAVAAAARTLPRHAGSLLGAFAVQAVLSYSASAVGKVAGAEWRDGSAVPGVLATATFGEPRLARSLAARPRLGRLVTWGVVVVEAAAPSVLLLPSRWTPAAVWALRAFHVANAGVMGLDRFTFSFAAVHPALVHVTEERDRVAGSPEVRGGFASGRAAVLTAAAVLAVSAVGRYVAVRRSGPVAVAVVDEGSTTVGREGVVVVVEPDVGVAGDGVAGLVAALRGAGLEVVQVDRPGLGRRRGSGSLLDGDAVLAAARRTARVVVDRAAGRPVVTVGIGHGASVAHAVAGIVPVAHAVVVDPMTSGDWAARAPDLLLRARRRLVDLAVTTWTLRLGGGLLRTGPRTGAALGSAERAAVAAADRDPRAWEAVRRELAAAVGTRLTLEEVLSRTEATVFVTRRAVVGSPALVEAWRSVARTHGAVLHAPRWLSSPEAASGGVGARGVAEATARIGEAVTRGPR